MSTRPAPVIAGNWKMHHGPDAAREFFRRFVLEYPEHVDRSVAFFPPAVSLAAAREAAAERADLRFGVQNVYWEPKGAFTGEISPPLAAEAGASLALVGHSERRQHFGETPQDTARKVAACVAAEILPVLCVGETLEQREAGTALAVVEAQLRVGLEHARPDRLLVAYEPVWAIGTGRTASPADAAHMHAAIRQFLAGHFGETAAPGIPILYGGSVKPDNAESLLAAPEIDGLLVGGASLDAGDFARICRAAG
jgi:triosephosphate isomerase